MRPAPIDDQTAEIVASVWPGAQRVVVGPPGGNLDSQISPVEAMVHAHPDLPGVKLLSVRCVLDDGDLEKLARGGAVWLTFFEHMVPFDVQVGE